MEFYLLHEVRQINMVASVDNEVCHLADITLQPKTDKDVQKGIKTLEINEEIVTNVNSN